METALRCNSLKCRAQLTEQAVVTTCSHIFCINCSRVLGLPDSTSNYRVCPACDTRLGNPDDVVVTQLNPSEDYKTSVLSGLSPGIIIECAGRGLAFYAYQATQEIVYQEFLAKGLSERHASLSSQMDQIIHDANAEIVGLRNKFSALQIDHEGLRNKYHDLNDIYGEKVRAHARTQKLYDTLKKQMLQLDVQDAAADAVSNTLDGPANRFGNPMLGAQNLQRNVPLHQNGATRRVSPGGSSGSGGRREMPQGYESREQPTNRAWQEHSYDGPTSSQGHHRTRLPFAAPAQHRSPNAVDANLPNYGRGGTSIQNSGTPRRPLGDMNANFIGSMRPTGYGMTSAVKSAQGAHLRSTAAIPGQLPRGGYGRV